MVKKYLTEENYERGKRKVKGIALVILVLGLLIGGSFIFVGFNKQNKVNSNYSSNSKQSLEDQLASEKQNLENRKVQLESQGITYNMFARYDQGQEYELKIITDVLDPSFNNCSFDEYKNNSNTSKYCSLKNQLENVSSDFNKRMDSFNSIPYYMIGGFILFATCMIAGSIFLFSKRREIAAFTAQQVMPIAKEGIDEMAPTVGNAAREISRGIKEGLKDDKGK